MEQNLSTRVSNLIPHTCEVGSALSTCLWFEQLAQRQRTQAGLEPSSCSSDPELLPAWSSFSPALSLSVSASERNHSSQHVSLLLDFLHSSRGDDMLVQVPFPPIVSPLASQYLSCPSPLHLPSPFILLGPWSPLGLQASLICLPLPFLPATRLLYKLQSKLSSSIGLNFSRERVAVGTFRQHQSLALCPEHAKHRPCKRRAETAANLRVAAREAPSKSELPGV